jgi:hypothetical protein
MRARDKLVDQACRYAELQAARCESQALTRPNCSARDDETREQRHARYERERAEDEAGLMWP